MRTRPILFVLVLTACGSDSGAGGPGGEICGNGVDDDGDGFFDCADQDCWSDAACADITSDATTSDATADTSDDTSGGPSTSFPDTTGADTTGLPDVSGTCDPCSDLGQIKGRVCAPSAQVFVNDADVVVSGTGCDGEPFAISTTSGHDGSYWLLDVPCGTHELSITKGSFSAYYSIPVGGGEITDVTGAANKLCLQASRTRIASLQGTWDDLAGLMRQLGFEVDVYIEESHVDPHAAGTIVELLSDQALLDSYDILLANCGAENGWMPQDHPELMAAVKEFVLRGGSLYMSDYAWVYGEWAFPTAVEWANDDDPAGMGHTDTSPQLIDSGTHSRATIADGTLAQLLGKTTMDIVFDQGPQIAPESVGPGTFAHIVGDISVPFKVDVKDAPLALSYRPAATAGRVIYTNFHNDAQATSDILTILNYLVFTL